MFGKHVLHDIVCDHLPTVASRLPVVALLSSDAKMPFPLCEMYLAVAMSSSWNGLLVLAAKLARVTQDKRPADDLRCAAARLRCWNSFDCPKDRLEPFLNAFGCLQELHVTPLAGAAKQSYPFIAGTSLKYFDEKFEAIRKLIISQFIVKKHRIKRMAMILCVSSAMRI